MTTKQRGGGKARKPRVLRARPLLVGVGATLMFAAGAGCGEMGVAAHPPFDEGIPADMGKPPFPFDLSKPPTD